MSSELQARVTNTFTLRSMMKKAAVSIVAVCARNEVVLCVLNIAVEVLVLKLDLVRVLVLCRTRTNLITVTVMRMQSTPRTARATLFVVLCCGFALLL